MSTKLRSHVAAALLLLAPATATLIATPAPAQRANAAAVHSLTLNADSGLAPGSTLQFSVEATPKSRVSVDLGGSGIVVPLRETSRGMYSGSYVVRRADRIDPNALLTARVARGKIQVAQHFSYPQSFQQLATGAAPTVAAPRIERFVVRPVGRLEPGRELRFRLEGAPGARVTIVIPGVTSDLPMREVRPGHYEGTYTVRQRDDLDAFTGAVAMLHNGRQWVTSRLDRSFVRDDTPPVLRDMTPVNGEVVGSAGRTHISGSFDDDGSGVDSDSVRIRISGRDVTDRARIGRDEFHVREDLPPGRHTAEVTLRDHAGNVTTKAWSFNVGTSMGAAGSAALPLVVTSPHDDATVDANGQVTVRGRTAPHAAVRVRVDAVTPAFGSRLGSAQTVLDDTVQADRDGFFVVTVPPRGLPLPGSRYEVSLTASQGAQTVEQRVVLHQRVS